MACRIWNIVTNKNLQQTCLELHVTLPYREYLATLINKGLAKKIWLNPPPNKKKAIKDS